MLKVASVVYRYLTDADFFNINKPRGTEAGGGGQSYIDFSTRNVPLAEWEKFLAGVPGVQRSDETDGPRWELPIGSIGHGDGQQAEIYQRRPASVIIARQKLGTRRSNRLWAWLPENGFPKPIDPTIRDQCPDGLVVYLLRVVDGGVWAGWFLNDGRSPVPMDPELKATALGRILRGDPTSEMIEVEADSVWLDENEPSRPFRTGNVGAVAEPVHVVPAPDAEQNNKAAEPQPAQEPDAESEESIDALFAEDVQEGTEPTYSIAKVRKRNRKAAQKLKELYRHRCQITDEEYLFRKRDGTFYTEVHHLIALGNGGADDPRNMIVLSPQLHKMLHHADVGPIDLSGIAEDQSGRWYLDIVINNKVYRIHWHPKHAELVRSVPGG